VGIRRQTQPKTDHASCNAKPMTGTLKMYLNVPQSSAERVQRTVFVLRISPE
jgi:hypothetical protein